MSNSNGFAAAASNAPMQNMYKQKEMVFAYALQGRQDALDLVPILLPMLDDDEFERVVSSCFVVLCSPQGHGGLAFLEALYVNQYERNRSDTTNITDIGDRFDMYEPSDFNDYIACMKLGLKYGDPIVVRDFACEMWKEDKTVYEDLLFFAASQKNLFDFDIIEHFLNVIENIGDVALLKRIKNAPETLDDAKEVIEERIEDLRELFGANTSSPQP